MLFSIRRRGALKAKPAGRGHGDGDNDGARDESRLSSGRTGEPAGGGLFPPLPAAALAS